MGEKHAAHNHVRQLYTTEKRGEGGRWSTNTRGSSIDSTDQLTPTTQKHSATKHRWLDPRWGIVAFVPGQFLKLYLVSYFLDFPAFRYERTLLMYLFIYPNINAKYQSIVTYIKIEIELPFRFLCVLLKLNILNICCSSLFRFSYICHSVVFWNQLRH